MISSQEYLRHTASFTHPDQNKSVCIYTEASDCRWAVVVTQSETKELQKEQNEPKHLPIAFLGSEFRGSARDWLTIDKAGFAIFSNFKKANYTPIGKMKHMFVQILAICCTFSTLQRSIQDLANIWSPSNIVVHSSCHSSNIVYNTSAG